jgi:DNA-binding NarL/FixJ family response regulator
VITAPGAAEGLAVLQSRPVALVISDERMPETTGSDFLAEVRRRWPSIRRVLLTGRPGSTVVVRGFEAGIDLLFHKPWDDRALKEAIRRLVSGTESPGDAGPRVDPPAAEDNGG